MGALHAGHASLMQAAREETGFVVVSIFVNPLQFGPTEDLARYPCPRETNLELCGREGVGTVFVPEAATNINPISIPQLRSGIAERALRGLAADSLSRRDHGGPETLQRRAAGCGLLRTKGCPASTHRATDVCDLEVPVELRMSHRT